MTGKTRQIYFGGTVPMIDVFFDKLDYCHEVNYDGRLELDPYSVSLADILLQKLQIWEINDKDLKDIEYLLHRGRLRRGRHQEDQRGLHRQAPRRRLGLLVHGHHQPRPGQGPRRRRGRARRRRRRPRSSRWPTRSGRASTREPKTKKWEKRAKKGTKKIWYNTGLLRLVSRAGGRPQLRPPRAQRRRGPGCLRGIPALASSRRRPARSRRRPWRRRQCADELALRGAACARRRASRSRRSSTWSICS